VCSQLRQSEFAVPRSDAALYDNTLPNPRANSHACSGGTGGPDVLNRQPGFASRDNALERSAAANYNISWHQNAHLVRKENLGLTCARLRGIAEFSTDLLVFLDDV